MALNPNELFNDDQPGLGGGKRVEAHTIQPKKFAAGSGTILKLTPLQFNTVLGQWEVWSGDAGTGTEDTEIAGFSWPDEIILDADEQVLGNVMLKGLLHFDDITLPAGETTEALQAACVELRSKGYVIQGLKNFR